MANRGGRRRVGLPTPPRLAFFSPNCSMHSSRATPAFLTVALSLAAGFWAAPRAAAQAPLTVTKVSIGFGGKYKSGFWNPVIVSLQAGSSGAAGQLELVVPDGDQVPVIFADEAAGKIDLAA